MQREKLLERVVKRLSRSMTSGDKHHFLLIGPRGSGKTHFVSLVAWDLQQRQELKDVMRIAWLGEDDSFTGLIHLAFGIAKQLAQEYPNEFPSDFKSDVRGLPPDDAALTVLQTVAKQLKGRSLILITENMDQTFRALGDSGRKKWRAFLQETRSIAMLATSQQLFDGVSKRKEVFFGFFDIHHLEPLSVDTAQELISRISVEQNKAELVSFLNSPEGRCRIRALHYLAGGNHRMYVLLSEFLSKDSLEDLVTAFEDLANAMTPYFQERMRSLSDQQRQLAQCLCDTEGALTVKQIAAETFIEERTCSKQLGTLKGKGYVRSEKRGKESYYDMAEPLMRLCLEVKNQRGRPLQLVARFLRAWFPTDELQNRSNGTDRHSRVDDYCLLAAQSPNTIEREVAGKLLLEITDNISEGHYDTATELAKELQFLDKPSALEMEAALGLLKGEPDYTIEKLTAVIEMPDAPADQKAQALNNRGHMNWRSHDFEKSTADFESALSLYSVNAEGRTSALFNVVEPMIEHHSRKEIVGALKRAFLEGDAKSSDYGGTPKDLLWMVLRRSPTEWPAYISAIAALYIEYGVGEKLGQGVTKSIKFLDEGGFSQSQIETWSSAWQAAAKGIDDLQISLRCLDAAVDVMASVPPTDQPLFRLPLEIRELVRPLLARSLDGTGSSV